MLHLCRLLIQFYFNFLFFVFLNLAVSLCIKDAFLILFYFTSAFSRTNNFQMLPPTVNSVVGGIFSFSIFYYQTSLNMLSNVCFYLNFLFK